MPARSAAPSTSSTTRPASIFASRFSSRVSGRSARPSWPCSLLAPASATCLASFVGAAELGLDRALGVVAPDLELDALARRRHADQARQRARAQHRLAVDLGDHVARLQARRRRRAVGRDVRDERAVDALQAERIGERLVQVLHRHAEAAVLRLAGRDDLVLDLERDVDRDRERDALEAAAARVDLRVDADHRAAAVEERAARVAGVDRGVGLDEGNDRVARQRAPLGADDARVAVCSRPYGAPIASTGSPTSRFLGSPRRTTGRSFASIVQDRDVGRRCRGRAPWRCTRAGRSA